jgi:hypothetical protein
VVLISPILSDLKLPASQILAIQNSDRIDLIVRLANRYIAERGRNSGNKIADNTKRLHEKSMVFEPNAQLAVFAVIRNVR